MRGKNIVSLSLILMFFTIVVMDMRSVQSTNTYEHELYVDGFEEWRLWGWDMYGLDPWLNATDYPENYIESSEPGGQISNFTFENITLPSDQVITKVVLEGYCQYPEGHNDNLDIDVYSVDPQEFVWLGSLWGTEQWGWHTPRWIGGKAVSDVLRETLTEEGLNNLEVLLYMYWLGPEEVTMRVDCLRLKVYTGLSAIIDLEPDTVKLANNANYMTCIITLPSGFYANDIDTSTIMLDNLIAPVECKTPADGSLTVKFDMDLVKDHIENDLLEVGPLPQDVKLYVTFSLKDGLSFGGSDTIKVMACPKH